MHIPPFSEYLYGNVLYQVRWIFYIKKKALDTFFYNLYRSEVQAVVRRSVHCI